ncbi:MAG: hypothetical protein IT389_03770 [Nitrospira sp.]|nr:hypothetical protein [Nitrospira sp.]
MEELSEYRNEIVSLMQKRFAFIKSVVDSVMEFPGSAGSHKAEVYKSTLKSLARSDQQLILEYALKLATAEFCGGIHLIYAMLHLPNDTNEKGNWHRDGDSDVQRVFWLPLTRYEYNGLSYVPRSSSTLLSRPLSVFGSRTGKVLFSNDLEITSDRFFSWSPRLVHVGNLNTSGQLSCALQIFLDKSKKYAEPCHLIRYDQAEIARIGEAVRRAFRFNDCDELVGLDKAIFYQLPQSFREFMLPIYMMRTKTNPLERFGERVNF